DQFIYKKNRASGLAYDPVGLFARCLASVAKQLHGEPARLLAREWIDGQFAPFLRRRAGSLRLTHCLQAGARFLILAAIASHHQEPRRPWRFQKKRQQAGTVNVAPLQVINVDNEWGLRADASEHVTKASECQIAQLNQVLESGRLVRSTRNRGHAHEHWKDTDQRGDIPWD